MGLKRCTCVRRHYFVERREAAKPGKVFDRSCWSTLRNANWEARKSARRGWLTAAYAPTGDPLESWTPETVPATDDDLWSPS